MAYRADGRRENLRFKTVVVVNRADVFDQIHTVDVNIIQPTNERRDERRPCLGRQKRLIGRETQGYVHHLALTRQHLAGFQTIPSKRQLDGNVFGDPSKLAPLGDHGICFKCDNLGANWPCDQITNFFGHFENITPRFQNQRWVGRDPIDHAKVIQLGNCVDLGGINKEFHLGHLMMAWRLLAQRLPQEG